MADSTNEFRAISGCWRISLKHDEDGKLVGENYQGPAERITGYELPELVFRHDDPKSKAIVQGTARSLTSKPEQDKASPDKETSTQGTPEEQ